MSYTHKEIYDALQLIQNICDEYYCMEKGCSKCPFNMQGDCVFVEERLSPTEWKLNPPENWVAFR